MHEIMHCHFWQEFNSLGRRTTGKRKNYLPSLVKASASAGVLLKVTIFVVEFYFYVLCARCLDLDVKKESPKLRTVLDSCNGSITLGQGGTWTSKRGNPFEKAKRLILKRSVWFSMRSVWFSMRSKRLIFNANRFFFAFNKFVARSGKSPPEPIWRRRFRMTVPKEIWLNVFSLWSYDIENQDLKNLYVHMIEIT